MWLADLRTIPMAGNEQSGGSQFTVVKLPILGIVLETLALPFKHPMELAKYGWIPFVGLLGARLIEWFLRQFSVPGTDLWMSVAHLILFTPFSVTWTRVAIEKSEAKLPDRPFAFTRIEWQYLVATVLLMVAVVILLTPAFALYRYGQSIFDNGITFFGGMLLLLTGVAELLAFVRISLVFPAVAMERYEGVAAAWRQTAGNFEPLLAIIVLSSAPYYLAFAAVRLGVSSYPAGVSAMGKAFAELLAASLTATSNVAAPALAYQAIAMPSGTASAAGKAARGG